MKHFFRILVLFLSALSVVFFGYYAYILTTDTLSLPFAWQEKQSWDALSFVVSKPRFLKSTYDRNTIDSDSIIASLTLDGKPFDPTISWEWRLYVSGEYVSISSSKMTDSSILKLDASIYNHLKSTKYRLPRDMTLTVSKNPKDLSIIPIAEPRDKKYQVKLMWYPWFHSKDLRFYAHRDASKNCEIQDAWSSLSFENVWFSILESDTSGQTETAKIMLDFESETSTLCIIAGIGGNFYTVEDRRLSPFTLTGSLSDILSPEYNMQSRIDFEMSEDTFTDQWDLYSKEYISYRKNQKTLFLKNLSIRPNITLTEDNIVLSPRKASIVAPFIEWKNYAISLSNVTDIYGRKTSVDMDFKPVRTPFLSLSLSGRKTIFRFWDPIDTKLYSLKTPKKEYPLILCQISLEWYSQGEYMIAENDKKHIADLYKLLSSKEISGCLKKTIVINEDSTVSPFDIRSFSPTNTINPWLYILAFAQKNDIDEFDKFALPRVFSVIDTHLTLKVDASGKSQVLATDIITWAPRNAQSISLVQNIRKSWTEAWNPSEERYDRSYLPLSGKFFSERVDVWSTSSSGILAFKKENIVKEDYNTPYSLSFEPYYDYEWRYDSFLMTASGAGHFGYVVSTWNDGVTGWNFWLKDSDYSWETRPTYSAYIHTDRRLYLPGDRVYIHAIVRKNDAKLTIPKDTVFNITVTDPFWSIVKEGSYKSSEFGSFSTDFILQEEARLGSYSVNIEPQESTGGYYMMSNAFTSFQVEIFKNPTFTAEVTLRSPDIEDSTLLNLREVPNTDESNPWYSSKYESTFSLEGVVKAHYYNGQNIKNIPFSYRIYRNEYHDSSYWWDCFWWCFWQPSPEFYTEWTGTIDGDAFGFFRIPVNFSSFSSDYIYTAEVTIVDPLTWEEVVTPATLISQIPEKYKTLSLDNPLRFLPDKRIISLSETIKGKMVPLYGKWNKSLEGKYQYTLVRRAYSQMPVDDLRLSDITVSTFEETTVASGIIMSSGFTLESKWLSSWEYHLKVSPIVSSEITLPEYATTDVSLYVVWDFTTQNHNIELIPEKSVYSLGETARVLITLPFTGWYVYITREKWGVIDSEYLPIEGNTMIREYLIDESAVPNMYIWVVAFPSHFGTSSRGYAVWYTEIITDLADKKANIQIDTSKSVYTNGEKVDIWLLLTDSRGKPMEWEVTLMIVDESLIRLLWNIDLDIIPKFFQKIPFTIKTSLTAIGMERNKFLSRRWANGGSGGKWWNLSEISSRTLFKNTAYYNAAIKIGSSGRGSASFTLPDNITDYRIIAIAQTKSSNFGVGEKPLKVRRDYTLEVHIPQIAYPNDVISVTASAFNSTKKITQTSVTLSFWSGASLFEETKEIILSPNENKSVSFTLSIKDGWKWNIPYKVTMAEKGKILDSITKNFKVLSLPLLESSERVFGIFATGSKMLQSLSDSRGMSLLKSRVTLRVASSLLVSIDSVISSLLTYPYGCIEQTIASTLPNAFALKFSSILWSTIDRKTATKNLDLGVNKILRMQQFWGWKYWETDIEIHPHVTPYVVRSLLIFRDLGVDIPQSSIDAGVKYIEDMVNFRQDLYQNDWDFAAEIFYTLARTKSNYAKIIEKAFEPDKLSRHGYLMYAYGLQILDRLSPTVESKLSTLMKQVGNEDYWYWSQKADTAIYIQFLVDTGKIKEAWVLLDAQIRKTDFSSYFVSTQEKIQLFSALLRYSLLSPDKVVSQVALRGEALIADLSLSPTQISQKVDVPRWKMGDTFTLTRSNTEAPLYYEVLEYNIPDDMLSAPPRSAWGMSVTRTFERIDESRWITKNGEYLGVSPMNDTVFTKWQLYRVTLRVKIPDTNATWQHLTLEDFVPGWWKPMRWIFQTESKLHSDSTNDFYSNETYWGHIEAHDDRILATTEQWYGTTKSYSYFIRPEYVGSYILPPVTAYFMYLPEIHAIWKFEKIIVK